MNGTDTPSIAYCRACGKALTEEQQKRALGTVYCEEHLPKEASAAEPAATAPGSSAASSPNDGGASPWTAPPTAGATSGKYSGAKNSGPTASPGLAFLLGLIPGVGAIYNGQYAKGLLHVVIMGTMASIAASNELGSLEWMIGMLLIVFPFYMAFEAYHTALRREKGLPVDEFSSILPLHAGAGGFPIGPVALIAAGVIFLLHNLGALRISQIVRFWPVLLIVLGIYMIYVRINPPSPDEEARHEQ